MSPDEMYAAARELVADWPPLDAQQRAQIATLLRPAGRRHRPDNELRKAAA
jgi:hypothetical protein